MDNQFDFLVYQMEDENVSVDAFIHLDYCKSNGGAFR